MIELNTFRSETRAWLEANCPESLRDASAGAEDCWGGRNWQFASADQEVWLHRMVEKGWTVPNWPREYGGAGLNRERSTILAEEMSNLNCPPPLSSFGIWMLGPALLKFGTEELKEQHLPPIARGEIRWCQGYSEPGAGSDLAAVATNADDHGDHYLLNGQKVWVSYGDRSDAIFLLVRTNQEASKHNGISFVLADMAQDGIEARPITLISGKSDFCEVFFNDARVEKDQVVGEVDHGWDVAKYLLTHEREMQAGFGFNNELPPLPDLAREYIGTDVADLSQSGLREKIAELEIDALAFENTMSRYHLMAGAGASLGAKSSLLKYYGTELNKRRNELTADIMGLDAADWNCSVDGSPSIAQMYLRSKGNSIEGGTSEIQLNIMAKFLLGLPTIKKPGAR